MSRQGSRDKASAETESGKEAKEEKTMKSAIMEALFEAYQLRDEGKNMDALIERLEEQLFEACRQECDEERRKLHDSPVRSEPDQTEGTG
jgi:two-component sensor histidine kinase